MNSGQKGILITVIFAAAILIFLGSIFLWKPDLSNRQVEYNYFVFEELGGLWETSIVRDGKPYSAIFRFNPEQVEDVYITGNFSGFKKKPIYLTFDPNASKKDFKYLTLAASELSLHLVRGLDYEVAAACTTNETDACQDRSVITCDADESVIYIVPKAPTQITLKDDCVVLSGENFELLKSVDRLLFQWYKIMR